MSNNQDHGAYAPDVNQPSHDGGMYRRFAEDYRYRYQREFGHNAPKSMTDFEIVQAHLKAWANQKHHDDASRRDEVLLHMLYWVNPAIRAQRSPIRKDWLHHG